jgi:hypothetical protein
MANVTLKLCPGGNIAHKYSIAHRSLTWRYSLAVGGIPSRLESQHVVVKAKGINFIIYQNAILS